jgi:fatty-acyl-CoA synthase
MLAHAPADQRMQFQHTVTVATGGAAPPSAVFRSMEALGFRVTHLYGATETYGPATSCVFQPEWNKLPDDERFARMARQGVAYPMVEAVTVANPKTMAPVRRDDTTVGEITLRGNTVMKGYLKNEAATAKALVGNWFLSGDLAVWHPDGEIEIKDRSKDIIISGGENISSLEVEEVLMQHPAVMLAAVVARRDEKWGETPCAFLELKPGASRPDDKEVIAFCRARLAHFKVPKTFIYCTLPKASTGKIQKFTLRDQADTL